MGGRAWACKKVDALNRSWSSEEREKEREREGKWRLDQDQGSVKLDMRQTIAVTCALDGGNYAH